MAKNTGIERSKKNPIALEHRTWRIGYPQSAGSFITCIEHRYAVVLFGFSGHDATFSSMWPLWLIPNIYFFQFE
jgi:hypothetical protein